MAVQFYLYLFIIAGLMSCSNEQTSSAANENAMDRILKIEMNLSAFGVESDNFPYIHAVIDFSKDTSICIKTFDNPANKSSNYALSKSEMNAILKLLKTEDLEKLKKAYEVGKTDQPRSITKIYTTKKTYEINDYGLEGDHPLPELLK